MSRPTRPRRRRSSCLRSERGDRVDRHRVVERRGIEPLTFRLPDRARDAISPGNPPIESALSSGLSSEAARDPLALADEVLAVAARSTNPAPLIAAARALVFVAWETATPGFDCIWSIVTDVAVRITRRQRRRARWSRSRRHRRT